MISNVSDFIQTILDLNLNRRSLPDYPIILPSSLWYLKQETKSLDHTSSRIIILLCFSNVAANLMVLYMGLLMTANLLHVVFWFLAYYHYFITLHFQNVISWCQMIPNHQGAMIYSYLYYFLHRVQVKMCDLLNLFSYFFLNLLVIFRKFLKKSLCCIKGFKFLLVF